MMPFTQAFVMRLTHEEAARIHVSPLTEGKKISLCHNLRLDGIDWNIDHGGSTFFFFKRKDEPSYAPCACGIVLIFGVAFLCRSMRMRGASHRNV